MGNTLTQVPTLTAALYYASRGWRVFPCLAHDKKPAITWADDATIVPDKIKAWWNKNSAYNLAIVTGAESGIVVVDVDADKGGSETLLSLVAEHGTLPHTPESLTGGGGRHIVFKHPGLRIPNSAGKLGPGLDVRGDGGYIVAPPSIHPNGNAYEWEVSSKPSQTPLAPMPNWLILELAEPNPANGSSRFEPHPELPGELISEGGRNQFLTSLAGSMRRRGMDNDAIYAALWIENQRRCQPPLSADEVTIISKSVTRYAPTDAPRPRKELAKIECHEPKSAYEGCTAFLDLLDNLDGRSIPTFVPPIDKSIGGLERQTLSILAARPSMGKSTLAWQIARNTAANGMKALFFSLEMSLASLWAKAVCSAAGLRWRDVRSGNATGEQMTTIYLAAEVLVQRYNERLLVDDAANTSETIWQSVERYRPDLVIVDHLRLVADRNESEVQRLGYVSQQLKDIAKEFNCHVLALAQLNRGVEARDNKRPTMADLRDSGQIEENADLVLMMFRDDYYNPPVIQKSTSRTELLVRKFRDDIANQLIMLSFDTARQWFEGSAP